MQNVNASLLISIDLIATHDAFSVAKDDDARAKAAVDPITLPFLFTHKPKEIKGENKRERGVCVCGRDISHTKSKN